VGSQSDGSNPGEPDLPSEEDDSDGANTAVTNHGDRKKLMSSDSARGNRRDFFGLLLGALGLIVGLVALLLTSPNFLKAILAGSIIVAIGGYAVIVRSSPRDWFVIISIALVALTAGVSGATLMQLVNPSSATPTIRIQQPFDGSLITSHPTISGSVAHLTTDQEVWSFNEPFTTARLPKPMGRAYPDAGPCRISGSSFTCSKDFPVGPHPNCRKFILWVAVVTVQQGNMDNNIKDGLGQHQGLTFLTIDHSGPPHVGTAVDRIAVQRYPKSSKAC
jgi:hypothetical protein